METWQTYQLYMMSLSIALVLALLGGEFVLRKFEILHVMYNQMLRLKDRQLICFNQFDVTDNAEVRASTFMMTRLTIVLVVCYIWQFCVLESFVIVGSAFPESLCNPNSEFTCYQTAITWDSFLKASTMIPIDCSRGSAGFNPIAPSFGIACFQVIKQNAAIWLQSLAVSNALGLFLIRLYEVLVWLCVSSLACLIGVTVLALLSAFTVVATTISGYASSFSNNWLGFMAMAVLPFLLFVVRSCAVELRRMKREDLQRLQRQTKADFNRIAHEFANSTDITNMDPNASFPSNNIPGSDGLRQRSAPSGER